MQSVGSSAHSFGSERNGNGTSIKPKFARNAAERFNIGSAKQLRLNDDMGHEVVAAQRAYCVLCTWTLTKRVHRKVKSRKNGSHMTQWCRTCLEPICEKCWSSWHSLETLKRRKSTDEEIQSFEESFSRSTGQRVT